MASFSISSVLFSASASQDYKETKQGTYVYKGDGINFYEWEFRTKLRVAGKTGEHYVDAVSKIVDGLRGDAFVVAQEVGLESLHEHDGVETLTKKMREMVFPMTTQEAKELFRQYTKPNGLLSRQQGESMKQ